MNTKNYIIELSKEYSIVTQFTSFVAIEKREKDEVMAADAPTMAELVEQEDVDQLAYMSFEKVGNYYEVWFRNSQKYCENAVSLHVVHACMIQYSLCPAKIWEKHI